MSTWLDRLKALDSEKHAGAVSANSADSKEQDSPNGTIGTIGTGISAQKDVSETPWHERLDVRLVVEDLFRERWHRDRIARHLGLTRAEVRLILKRV
jgi:hypothetical protein